jgi:phage N-6-adenine-methyltransferase
MFMSTEIAKPFDPRGITRRLAKADAVAKVAAIDAVAAKAKEWPLLEGAIDAKIEDQEEFVRWWDENVGVRQSPGGVDRASNADLRSMLSRARAEELTGITQQQVSSWRKKLVNTAAYRASLFERAYREAMNLKINKDDREAEEHTHQAKYTGENEWFTPESYIEQARSVLGDFDLDPASNEIAQRTVKARKFFTKQDDGLAQKWHGRVWLNPPYAQPAIDDFITKLVLEYQSGNVSAAILLTHNSTDTAWFHRAADASTGICFTRGRVRFVSPSGELASPTQGQAFFYFGPGHEVFRSVFSNSGFVCSIGRAMAA